MNKAVMILLFAIPSLPLYSTAQQTTPNVPNPPAPSQVALSASTYTPPTETERLRTYFRHTYGLGSILEAAARGGIDQARDRPSEWPQGGQGYADRFGSAMGEVAIRGTTQYLIGAALGEDLRIKRCRERSFDDKFKSAFKDTFTARKGKDGHTAFSVARIVGPISGSVVAKNTWYPSTDGRSETAQGIGISFGMVFGRNLVKEILAR